MVDSFGALDEKVPSSDAAAKNCALAPAGVADDSASPGLLADKPAALRDCDMALDPETAAMLQSIMGPIGALSSPARNSPQYKVHQYVVRNFYKV